MAAQESAMTTLTDLERALRTHDWWYEYSDDHSLYSRGRAERDKINWMIRALESAGQQAEAKDLYKKIQQEKLG